MSTPSTTTHVAPAAEGSVDPSDPPLIPSLPSTATETPSKLFRRRKSLPWFPSTPCSGSRSGERLTPTKQVYLVDWWLIKAQSDSGDKRLGVGGTPYSENGAARCFLSAPIAKRCHAVLIETVDGFQVMLEGTLNRSATLENGFDSMVCDNFEIGFPYNWEGFVCQSPDEKTDSRPNGGA